MKYLTSINIKVTLVALLVIAAVAALAGHSIIAPELFASLGAAPMFLGETTMYDVKTLIEKQGDAWEEFKRANSNRLGRLEDSAKMFENFAAKMGSPLVSGVSMGGVASSAETKAFFDLLRTGRESSELKNMQSGTDPQGGYLLPTDLDRRLSKNLRELSPMRQLAEVIQVGGPDLKLVHSVGGTATAWTGETSSRPETTAPSLAQITIPTREVYAMPAITQNLLDDNVFDLENWLIEELSEAFGDAEGDAFINGNGVAKPRGLFTADTVSTADATREYGKFQYIPTGASGAFHTDKADALIKLVYAVKPAYRKNASWLMSPEVLEAVRKMKLSASDQYVWTPSLSEGQPSRLLGYPVFEDANIPAMAANSLSAAFGDFGRSYTITDRSTSLLRDPYTQKPFVVFYSAKRVGGGIGRDSRAVKFLKFSAS